MADTMIDLTCDWCEDKFTRRLAEHKYARKVGRVGSFCSRACGTRHRNKGRRGKPQDTSHLDPANRRDKYSPFRAYLRHCRMRGKENSRKEVTITLGDLKDQWELQGGRCPYTGWQLEIPPTTGHYENGNGYDPRKPSLDRIDSSGGYVPGNIQFVATIANYAKHNWDEEVLIDFCNAVASNT